MRDEMRAIRKYTQIARILDCPRRRPTVVESVSIEQVVQIESLECLIKHVHVGGAESEEQLIRAFSGPLNFPSYSQGNWDAFVESLVDATQADTCIVVHDFGDFLARSHKAALRSGHQLASLSEDFQSQGLLVEFVLVCDPVAGATA